MAELKQSCSLSPIPDSLMPSTREKTAERLATAGILCIAATVFESH
jgi:hypothetical protein